MPLPTSMALLSVNEVEERRTRMVVMVTTVEKHQLEIKTDLQSE